jgi:hypothetical protein
MYSGNQKQINKMKALTQSVRDQYSSACIVLDINRQGLTDSKGMPLVDAETVAWAKTFLSNFLKNVHRIAKKMIGHYYCRLRLAFIEAFAPQIELTAKAISQLLRAESQLQKQDQANTRGIQKIRSKRIYNRFDGKFLTRTNLM